MNRRQMGLVLTGAFLLTPFSIAMAQQGDTKPRENTSQNQNNPSGQDSTSIGSRIEYTTNTNFIVDTDGDGVEDSVDNCPNEAGPASNNGCPEVADSCISTYASWASTNNCIGPINAAAVGSIQRVIDKDGKGSADFRCDQNGPDNGFWVLAQNYGCEPPPPDDDIDGVTNASDSCPYQYGPASNNGCPVSPPSPPSPPPSPVSPPDDDGDGVTNTADNCPYQSGPSSNNGCPVSPPPSGYTFCQLQFQTENSPGINGVAGGSNDSRDANGCITFCDQQWDAAKNYPTQKAIYGECHFDPNNNYTDTFIKTYGAKPTP